MMQGKTAYPVKVFWNAARARHVLDDARGTLDQHQGSIRRGVFWDHNSPALHGVGGELKALDDVQLD